MTKECKRCGQLKPLSEYHKQKTYKLGLDNRCKPCRKELASEDFKNNWFKYTHILKKAWAKKQGIPYNLNPEYLESIWTEQCPISGLTFQRHSKDKDECPALDRIVPSKGYIIGNVVYISARANRIKYNASVEELRQIADWLEGATTISSESTLK